jgi:hypothetical protein
MRDSSCLKIGPKLHSIKLCLGLPKRGAGFCREESATAKTANISCAAAKDLSERKARGVLRAALLPQAIGGRSTGNPVVWNVAAVLDPLHFGVSTFQL